MAIHKETPSQTAGPYVHLGLATDAAGFRVFAPLGDRIAGPNVSGERIRVEGRIFDGEGALMPDAMLEIWQADACGRYATPSAEDGFNGFGRAVPDFETGIFRFETIKPGAVNGAPHLNLWIVARGINLGLHTRLYFADEHTNDSDPILSQLAPTRRATLIASRHDKNDLPLYQFDIQVQGKNETVFFDV